MNFVNITSLTLGLSVFFLISLFLYQETSYEKDFSQRDNIYQVSTHFYNNGDLAWTPNNLRHVLSEVPSVNIFTVFERRSTKVYQENQVFEGMKVLLSDSSFFQVFDYQLISGEPTSVLNKPNTVVITENAAIKMFGSTDVVGATIYVNKDQPLIINGVSKVGHFKSQLDFDLVISQPYSSGINETGWGSVGSYTYVLAHNNIELDDLNYQLESISERYIYPLFAKSNSSISSFDQWKTEESYLGFFAEPLMSLRTSSETLNLMAPQLNRSQFNTLMIISLAALLISVINFINISTAKASIRMGEVAVKRILGSSRGWLVLQFMMESFLLILLSALLALALVEGIVRLNPVGLAGIVGYSVIHSGEWLLALSTFLILLTFISGIYPALYLSSGKFTNFLRHGALKNGFSLFNAVLFRKVATVVQFVLSITLIAGVITMFQQLNYLHEKDLGYETEGVFVLDNTYKLKTSTEAFRDELMKQSFVESAAYADHFPNQPDLVVLDLIVKSEEGIETAVTSYRADPTFFEAMSMKFTMGEAFPEYVPSPKGKENTATTYPVVINEAAVKALQLKEPIGSIIDNDRRIVGVVNDFVFSGLRQSIGPVMIGQKNVRPYYKLAVKMTPGNFDIERINEVWSGFSDEKLKWYTLSNNYDRLINEEKSTFNSVVIFSIFTIAISCLGLFGLAVFTMDQRVKEFGIRKVLGATISDIVRLFGLNFLKLILLAFLIAIPISIYGLNLWLTDFSDRISLSPQVYLITGALTLLIVFSTIAIQSLKAGKLNPVDTLRSE
ncbi:MAG: hypothetical protein HEP71_27345 [Roseivirga sp.]|nr:hypothetical protein [Roseivirga sp.]